MTDIVGRAVLSTLGPASVAAVLLFGSSSSAPLRGWPFHFQER